ncbi:hypothetical protein EST38_g9949 [Candolleomyces aberdarensis]|uniref:MYND-type domain-containing protein n=1 Tax=Candolleomyces aberdarensis TaxID=2316362 RepID=A0A4Q2D9C5_9AGAR|nr:hypothetical protein EST38_g9949 [Candolleomyces aberdarensis]
MDDRTMPNVILESIKRMGQDLDKDSIVLEALQNIEWNRGPAKGARTKMVIAFLELASDQNGSLEGTSMGVVLGSCLSLCSRFPVLIFTEAFDTRSSSQTDLWHLMSTLVRMTDFPSQHFPQVEYPLKKVLSLASSVVGRLLQAGRQLFETPANLRLLAIVVLRLWSWGGGITETSRLASVPWKPTGEMGTELMLNILTDADIRTHFFKYCSSEGLAGWETLASWAIGRATILRHSNDHTLFDIYKITLIFQVLIQECGEFSSLVDISKPLRLLSKAVTKDSPITRDHAAASSTLMAAVYDTTLEPLWGKELRRKLTSLLSSGLLSPLRIVVNHTNPNLDNDDVRSSWSLFVRLVELIQYPQCICALSKATEALSQVPPLSIHPAWKTFVGITRTFNEGYAKMLEDNSYGLCDNLQCTKTRAKVKRCSKCQQAFYCSERCRLEDWLSAHAQDCKEYREGALPKNKTSLRRRCFLAYGLSRMLAEGIVFAPTSNPRLTELQQDTECVQLYRLDTIPSPWINYNVNSILRSKKPQKASRAFTEMLILAKNRNDLKLAALYFEDDIKKDKKKESDSCKNDEVSDKAPETEEGSDPCEDDEGSDKALETKEGSDSRKDGEEPDKAPETEDGSDSDEEYELVKSPAYLFCLFQRSTNPLNSRRAFIPIKATETGDLGLLIIAEATPCTPVTVLHI